jgi:protein-tyrosine phosphatase
MDEDETEGIEEGLHYFPYEDMLEDLGEERNIVVEIARYGIEAGSLPDDAEVSMILDSIDAEIDGRNSPTMVHCSDGLGRTAVIVGCYLARHDIAVGAEVIERIQALRAVGHPESTDGRSPENIVQERMISRWKPGR